jgi:ASCH domain
MKALSIKQPWASLIAHGIKDIENRTWKTKFRGRIFIHASAKGYSNYKDLFNWEQAKAYWSKKEQIIELSNIKSAIIGEVDIIDCVINHPSVWAEKSLIEPNKFDKKYWGNNFAIKSGFDEKIYKKDLEDFKKSKPIYNWVLANPILYEKPILNVKGKLSLWDFNLDELKNS